MNSRMEKYANSSLENMSRTSRNQEIYNSTDLSSLSRIKTNDNVSVISDAHKEIDIEKIKKYVSMMEPKEEKKQRISLELPKEEEKAIEVKREKDYDINSILEKAKDKRELDYEENRHRKFDNNQIEILKKLSQKQVSSEDDEDITGPIEELNTEEKTIVDLIKNIKTNSNKEKQKDIFSDLMGDDDETIVKPIDEISNNKESNDKVKEELLNMTQDLESIKDMGNDFTKEINIEKEKLKELEKLEESYYDDDSLSEYDEEEQSEEDNKDEEESEKIGKIDKSFYTNSMTFNKSDFEGFEDLEKSTSKSSTFTIIAIIFIILLLAISIFLVLNYILEWNII